MRILFKIWGVLFGLLFLISAALQYNDPDPIIWILIYGVATVMSFMFAFNKVGYKWLILLSLGGLLGFVYMFPEKFEGFEIGNGDIKNIEEAREAFGLLIIAMSMLIFGFRVRYKTLLEKKE